jgi:hypothetical protein
MQWGSVRFKLQQIFNIVSSVIITKMGGEILPEISWECFKGSSGREEGECVRVDIGPLS